MRDSQAQILSLDPRELCNMSGRDLWLLQVAGLQIALRATDLSNFLAYGFTVWRRELWSLELAQFQFTFCSLLSALCSLLSAPDWPSLHPPADSNGQLERRRQAARSTCAMCK